MTDQTVALRKLAFISIFPEMLSGLTEWGVTGRAARDELYTVEAIDPREFAPISTVLLTIVPTAVDPEWS